MGFKIQVVSDEGEVAKCWTPGHVAEHEFVNTLADAIAQKGVGVMVTQSQVRQKAAEAIEELLWQLKKSVHPSG